MKGFNCITALKALSELSRMRILRVLLKERLGVNEIAERVGISQYNASKHLRILREAGLVEMEKDGKQHLCSVTAEFRSRIDRKGNTLELDCCTFRFDKLPR